MNIYVGNLPFSASEEEVRALFSEYGEVEKVTLPTDRDTGKVRGFGFVIMPNSSEAETAISQLNGSQLAGRSLRVNEAKQRDESTSRPRSSRPKGHRPGGSRNRF